MAPGKPNHTQRRQVSGRLGRSPAGAGLTSPPSLSLPTWTWPSAHSVPAPFPNPVSSLALASRSGQMTTSPQPTSPACHEVVGCHAAGPLLGPPRVGSPRPHQVRRPQGGVYTLHHTLQIGFTHFLSPFTQSVLFHGERGVPRYSPCPSQKVADAGGGMEAVVEMTLVHHCPRCWDGRKESRGWLPGQLGPGGGGPETRRPRNPAPQGKEPRTLLGKGREWGRQGREAGRQKAHSPPVLGRLSLTGTCLRAVDVPGHRKARPESGRGEGGMQGAWGGRGPESRSQDKGRGVQRLGTGGTEGLGTSPSLSNPYPRRCLPSTAWLEGCGHRPGVRQGGALCSTAPTRPRQQPALDVRSSGIRLPQGV